MCVDLLEYCERASVMLWGIDRCSYEALWVHRSNPMRLAFHRRTLCGHTRRSACVHWDVKRVGAPMRIDPTRLRCRQAATRCISCGPFRATRHSTSPTQFEAGKHKRRGVRTQRARCLEHM